MGLKFNEFPTLDVKKAKEKGANFNESIKIALQDGIIRPDELLALQEAYKENRNKIIKISKDNLLTLGKALSVENPSNFQGVFKALAGFREPKITINQSSLGDGIGINDNNQGFNNIKQNNSSTTQLNIIPENNLPTTQADIDPVLQIESEPEKLEEGFTLTKSDFKKYFEGQDFQQQTLGNCWLVATMDSIASYGDYEELVRKSVTKTPDGFKIIMPLGSPTGQGKEFTITSNDLLNQKSLYGKDFNLINGKDGIKAIMIAYGKLSSGKDHFDLMTLEGGYGGTYFNTLVYGINSYSYKRNYTSPSYISYGDRFDGNIGKIKGYLGIEDSGYMSDLKKSLESFNPNDLSNLKINVNLEKGKITNNYDNAKDWLSVKSIEFDNKGDGKVTFYGDYTISISELLLSSKSFRYFREDKGFSNELRTVLEGFHSKKQLLTVTINQGYSSYDKLYSFKESILGDVAGPHEVSVEKSYEKDGQLFVTLSNPWDSSKSYDISFDDLMKSCSNYTLGSKVKKDNLTPAVNSDAGMRVYSNKVSGNSISSSGTSDNKLNSLNEVIQSTGKINNDTSLSRGDVIVQQRGSEYWVESWGKQDTYLTYSADKSITFHIGGKAFSLNENIFSTEYSGKTNEGFKWYLYGPRLSVFINRIRHEYLDVGKGNPNSKNLFKLGSNGSLEFADDVSKHDSLIDRNKRRVAQILGDDTISLLKDWSLIGIKPEDTDSKSKIIGFLNSLV